MRIQLHVPSVLLGAAALACVLAVAAFAGPLRPATTFEYKIVTDPEDEDVISLAEDGFEFVGYLGKNKRGSQIDDTLWRREKK